MMRSLLIGLFTLFFISIGDAQKYRIEALTVADGLSQGFVIKLFQDSRGFIWIGTSNGLNRYDGYQIKRFTPDNTAPWALKTSVIYGIAEDANGLLWLGTEKGLVVMDPYTERFVHLAEVNPTFPNGKLVQLTIKRGQIWFSELKAENGIYVTRPPADLTRLIRENRLQSSDFSWQPIQLTQGVVTPFGWFLNSNDTVIGGADRRGQFCRIDSTTLQAYPADPHTLDYRRWGNYGLLYSPAGTSGFVFPLHTSGDSPKLMEFLQPPGEAPLLYCTGEVPLYQLDTLLSRPETMGFDNAAFYQQLPTFIQLDKPISYNGIVDLAGNIWMGTTGYGVRKISRRKLDFKQYLPEQSFYNFTVLPDGRIWPGFYQPHKVLNLQTNKLEEAPWAGSLPKDIGASALLIARSGNWWMTAWRKDQMLLLKKEVAGQRWQELPIKIKFVQGFPTALLEDRHGNIWVAGAEGELLRIRPGNNRVDTWQIGADFPTLLTDQLRGTCLVEDASGAIWVGFNYGLLRIEHPDTEPAFQVWHNHGKQGSVFKNEYIMSLYPDPYDPQILWVGTRSGGFSRFNYQTGTGETFTEKDGLADNVVYGILPDTFGYLWLSTNRGLSRFNPRNRTFSNVPNAEPKLNIEFNTGAYRLLPSGELAFGSVGGLFVIRPLAEQQREHPYVVEITQLKINGMALNPSDGGSGLTFTSQNEVILQAPFDHNNIVFEFAALQTGDPASAQYRYRVLGLEGDWIPTGHQRTVNLVAIPPGDYTIELQSIGANGSWVDAPVTRMYMAIRPPWYRSWPAWLLYLGLASLLLYVYIRYERKRVGLKYEVDFSRKEMERLKSLDDFKNRFFGYISHEFKTPLTIILGQTKRLADEQNPQEIAKNTGTILHQGQSMLEMVDQMVDITKLDNQKLQLNWRSGNISDYIHYLVESLRSLAEFKDIRLSFHTSDPELLMDFDPLRLKYIINNLLTNAVRHTSSGGFIGIYVQTNGQDQLHIKVSDTGEGIAPEELPHIFDRYYQGNSNNPQPHHFGLGLAFVKDLLQLFAGTISVNSQPGSGSVFTIMLPITQLAAPLQTPFSVLSASPNNFMEPKTSRKPLKKTLPLLLIVEDNAFIAKFLQSALENNFLLEFAADGLAGYEKAIEIVPDLILTDVMMPGMDGYELTRQLKNHELTGHIPVVMLSARSGLSDRLTGQQLGADAYLGKPFDEQELILILQNLHRLQHRWRERYAGLATQTSPANDSTETLEQPEAIIRQTDAFMLKIYALFADNYANEDYDLPQLCHNLEMSKSQLQRKLTALSDQSAMQLLRRYRLQKAYDILAENPDYNVKEICYQVGFKDPAHFSRLFSKTFQVAPSEVKRKVAADTL